MPVNAELHPQLAQSLHNAKRASFKNKLQQTLDKYGLTVEEFMAMDVEDVYDSDLRADWQTAHDLMGVTNNG